MPCRMYDEEEHAYEKLSKALAPKDTPEYKALLAKADKATRLLCFLCRRILEDEGGMPTPEIRAWFSNHEKEDVARIKREKTTALAKLTAEEKELLGLTSS